MGIKTQWEVLFVEPLDINSVGKLLRSLTKKARTADEQPLRLRNINGIKKCFEPHFFSRSFVSPLWYFICSDFENPSNSLITL
jgi:hypothetical protein